MRDRQIVNELKQTILTLAYKMREGHIPSSFSIMDILWVLYDKVIDFDKDKFILSKGHGSLALYTILNEKGFITDEQLNNFDAELGGHPKLNPKLGIYASTGSLGHGFPISVGMAFARKINNIDGTIYCLVGDGECNEGTIYESLALATQYNLDNLCLIVDNNKSLNLGNFEQKASSFGWYVESVPGHSYCALENAMSVKVDTPKCIVAHTIKGYGIKRIENDPQKWHHSYPTEQEYLDMLEELSQ